MILRCLQANKTPYQETATNGFIALDFQQIDTTRIIEERLLTGAHTSKNISDSVFCLEHCLLFYKALSHMAVSSSWWYGSEG